MITFIHAADIHLDSPLRGLSRYDSAPAEAIRDSCRRAFINLVDLAIDEKVAFILLAGDLYDGDWKDYSTGIFLSQQMGRLARQNIQVFSIAGNHDAANRMTKALDTPENMKILSASRAETISIDQLGVAIHGRSFATMHVSENLAASYPQALPGLVNIGLLHTSLDGRPGHDDYAPCSIDDLRSKNYHYWALGHVHQQEIISREPWIVFAGCIQGRHIRETGPKGCLLVTLEDGEVGQVTSVPLDLLRWASCSVDLTGCMEMAEVVERSRRAIEDQRATDAELPMAMRLHYFGATALADQLAAYPERFEQQIRALGAELAGDELWIERIENVCTGQRDLETALSDQDSLAKLLKEILATADNPSDIEGFEEIVTELRQKIPAEAFGPDSPLNLDENTTTRRLLQEAKDLLIGRLLSKGDCQ